MSRNHVFVGIALLAVLIAPGASGDAQGLGEWKAGVAKVVITPERPIWMAGYASRNKPSEGKLQDLYAKALALEDQRGGRVVLVTTDLIGFPRVLAEAIASRAGREYGLARERLLLNSSHTHTGPALRENLVGMYDLNAEQAQAISDYSRQLQDKVVAVIGAALKGLAPAKLSFGHANVGFGVNRRQPTDKGYRIGVNPQGPADQDVPVLRVDGADGRLRAVVFGYACHNTTLTGEFYKFSGDYAGYAQEALERIYPGATALFVMGCGADINPNPRSSLELALKHGESLAEAVRGALSKELKEVHGPVRAAFDRVSLPFSIPSSDEFKARLNDENPFRRRHAERMLSRMGQGKLLRRYLYPVQVFQFGQDLTLIALAGEVVVDYVLRLKRELGADGLWVAGYSNDVFAYIPSERVLREGGYEAEGAMIYYDLPGPFSPGVEERIIKKVHELVRRCRGK